MADKLRELKVSSEDAGKRLDQYLVSQITDVSRARVQQLIGQGKVHVDGRPVKASLKLRGNEDVRISGSVNVPPLKAVPEDIPLEIIFEDTDLAVINKPAGMMVHAGVGATDEERNRGTLVNALLHRFGALSEVGGDLRPGIVHRLDRDTSGLIIVAKNDVAHRKLAKQFSEREVNKQYVALTHGWFKNTRGTISAPISRDAQRRTRMTTRGSGGRSAVSHYEVVERIDSVYGKFTLLKVKIDTGRTHQIRVHLSSIGHPIVGDTLYGAPREIKGAGRNMAVSLERQFLHAARLEFQHPTTRNRLAFEAGLPQELALFLGKLEKPGDRDVHRK
jgi:23S rRNA pseudouridine1911/1915/1917 synthase